MLGQAASERVRQQLTKCDGDTQVDTLTSKGEKKTGAGDQTGGDDAATSRLERLVAARVVLVAR